MKDIAAAGLNAGKVTPSGDQAEVAPWGATSGLEANEANVRARPGRRSVEER